MWQPIRDQEEEIRSLPYKIQSQFLKLTTNATHTKKVIAITETCLRRSLRCRNTKAIP